MPRSPKLASGKLTPAERKRAERERRKARGEKQYWLKAEKFDRLRELVREYENSPNADLHAQIGTAAIELLDDTEPFMLEPYRDPV